MKLYTTLTKYNTYQYKRRVPKQLIEYANTSTFKTSLGSNKHEATTKAIEYNKSIDEALQLISLGISASESIVVKLKDLIPKAKNKQENKQSTLKSGQDKFESISSSYITTHKDTISSNETRDRVYFFNSVCPIIFEHIGLTSNPILKDITFEHLLQFKEIISRLPKRNIQKYRSMELSKVIKILDTIDRAEIIAPRTINKYIKWLRALYSFALVRGIITVNIAQAVPTVQTTNDRLQRLPLDKEEFNKILELLPTDKAYLLSVLAYSGMRLSEMYKCKVEEVDGVVCFSLMDRTLKLKTKSSYRLIPIHSSLLDGLDNFITYRDKVASESVARNTSEIIKKQNFTDSHKKSLYSLRHTFATELIKDGANNIHVSELLGHSLQNLGGMTLSRYANGTQVKLLKTTIERLNLAYKGLKGI